MRRIRGRGSLLRPPRLVVAVAARVVAVVVEGAEAVVPAQAPAADALEARVQPRRRTSPRQDRSRSPGNTRLA
jgi:hypothetical protein